MEIYIWLHYISFGSSSISTRLHLPDTTFSFTSGYIVLAANFDILRENFHRFIQLDYIQLFNIGMYLLFFYTKYE